MNKILLLTASLMTMVMFQNCSPNAGFSEMENASEAADLQLKTTSDQRDDRDLGSSDTGRIPSEKELLGVYKAVSFAPPFTCNAPAGAACAMVMPDERPIKVDVRLKLYTKNRFTTSGACNSVKGDLNLLELLGDYLRIKVAEKHDSRIACPAIYGPADEVMNHIRRADTIRIDSRGNLTLGSSKTGVYLHMARIQ